MMSASHNLCNEMYMSQEKMYFPSHKEDHQMSSSLLDMINQQDSRSSFPEKLHSLMLDAETMGFTDIVSWQDSGKSFKIHKPQEFQNDIIPRYFKPIKYTSFQRQLSIYGFQRIRTGWNTGGYEHPCFLRDDPSLCKNVKRHQKPSMFSQAFPQQTFSHGMDSGFFGASTHEVVHQHQPQQELDPLDTLVQEMDNDLDFEPLPLGSTCLPKVGSHGNLMAHHDDDHHFLEKLHHCFQEEISSAAVCTDDNIIVNPMKQQEDAEDAQLNNNKSAFFPAKLHQLLEDAERLGFSHIVSWSEDGRAFQIHDQKEFVNSIMNIYFDQSKFASFRRQLNLYGFNRTRTNNNRNMYFHEKFLQGNSQLCEQMFRRCSSGSSVKPAPLPFAS